MTRVQDSKHEIKDRRQHGFTLIEIAVVIVILAMTAMIVIPLLPATDAAELKDSARRLATVIRYLGERSVTTKSPYRIRLDLGESKVTITRIVNGEETDPGDPYFSRNILAEGVSIEDIEIPRLGKLGEGVVNLDFGYSGLGDFIVIHLKGSNGKQFTVMALPYGGRVEALDGYQELKL